MDMKQAWIDYKKEANKLKKYEKKIEKAQKQYNEYSEKALALSIDPEGSDMHCGISCISGRKSTVDILNCLQNTCDMKFKQDFD